MAATCWVLTSDFHKAQSQLGQSMARVLSGHLGAESPRVLEMSFGLCIKMWTLGGGSTFKTPGSGSAQQSHEEPAEAAMQQTAGLFRSTAASCTNSNVKFSTESHQRDGRAPGPGPSLHKYSLMSHIRTSGLCFHSSVRSSENTTEFKKLRNNKKHSTFFTALFSGLDLPESEHLDQFEVLFTPFTWTWSHLNVIWRSEGFCRNVSLSLAQL